MGGAGVKCANKVMVVDIVTTILSTREVRLGWVSLG